MYIYQAYQSPFQCSPISYAVKGLQTPIERINIFIRNLYYELNITNIANHLRFMYKKIIKVKNLVLETSEKDYKHYG